MMSKRRPVKEYCLVLFPYTAQNEDELTLDEGQIICIVTRDVEDKGWWKGELDGRVGVFPDNFVKLLPQELEEDKDKRPGRPPSSIIEQLNSNNKSTGLGSSSQLRRSSSQLKPAPGEIESLKPVYNEKLSKKVSDIFKKSNSNLSDKKTAVKNGIGGSSPSPVRPLTGPANHSPVRTKSPAPVKPVPGDQGTSAEAECIEVMEVKDDIESSETDCMWKPGVPEASTLTSVTSTRVKAPKRRPPSSIFLKENIPGLEELPVDSEDEIRPKDVSDESEDATTSVKLREKAEKVGVPVLQGREDTRDTGSKPSWLEELSRKQANRKSGIFTEDKKPDLPSPEIKPILPTKPSDTRKSLGSFIRRPGSFTDKDNASDISSETKDKPVRPAFPPSMPKAASSSTLPDRPESDHSTDRQTKSTEKRLAGRKSSETKKELTSSEQEQEKSDAARKLADFTNRLSEAGRFGNNKQSEPSKKVQDLNPKQSESGNKQPDVSRKHSDTGKGFESSKPSVHSTNLGRPEARSFAAVPERPADFSSPKGGLAQRIDNLSRTFDTKQEDPETSSKSEQDRSIGWSNHILKPERSEPEDSRMESSTRSVWSENRVRPEIGKPEPSPNTQQYQNKVVELERRLESISAEFAGQISALKSQLEKERDKRIDLEAEVASLARLVKSKKQ